MAMLRRLYDWTLKLAAKPYAKPALAAVSFAESSFFPIPPDVMLIPMALAEPKRAYFIAGLCTLASVIGGLFGYLIGYYLFAAIGQPILDFYQLNDEFAQFNRFYEQWGIWVIIIAGFTPLPYKVATIASGVAAFSLLPFMLGSLISRAARFFLLAFLLHHFGASIRAFIERYLGWLTLAFVALLLGGFWALRYLG